MNPAASNRLPVSPTADEAARTAHLLGELEGSIRRERAEKALQSRLLAELGDIAHAQSRRSERVDQFEFPRRAMAAEVAALVRVSPRVARGRIENARILTAGFPEALGALEGGRISQDHVDVIVDLGVRLAGDADARRVFDGHAVEIAEAETAPRLRTDLGVLIEKVLPTSAQEKHEKAREGRGVWVDDLQNGMSELVLRSTTLEVHAVYDRVTGMGRAVKRDRRAYARARDEAQGSGAPAPEASAPGTDPVLSDERTLPQLRADILTDLLLSAAPTGHRLHQAGSTATLGEIRATVQVTIPADVLAGRDDGPPAWIGAGSVISPAQARILAGDSPGWERLFVRPDTGDIVQTDHYRPTTGQVRALRARDVTCRFPGCEIVAASCDIDHTHPHAEGGPTTNSNLAHLCEEHHMLKHHSGWRVAQLPGGVMRWTAPSGRGYDTHPRSRVFFREAEHTTPPGDDAGAGRHDPNPNQSQNPNSSPDPVGQPGAAPSGVVWSDLDLPGAVWSEFDTSEFDTSEFEWPEPAAFDLVPPESGPIDPDDCFYTPDPEGDAANPDPDPYPEFPVLTTV